MSNSVLYDVAGPRTRRRVWVGSAVATLVVAVLLALAGYRLYVNGQFTADKWAPFVTKPALYTFMLEGVLYTLQAAAYALTFALVLGMLLAVGRLSGLPVIGQLATAIVEFFRGVPLLLLIFFFYLGVPAALGVSLAPLWSVVLGLTLYNGAVIAEIVRAGVLSLPKGQTEAAYAVGLQRGQVLRLVLLPQAIRYMLPALISQLVVLLKDTSLGFIISYQELLAAAKDASQLLRNPLQLYLFAALIYIVLNSALSALAHYVERRQRRRFGARAAVPGKATQEVAKVD